MALIRATSGGGSGGQTKSGTFTVNPQSWGGDTLGFQAKKLYICIEGVSNSAVGLCVYDEEQNIQRMVVRASTQTVKTFENYCHITSTGFEIRNDFQTAGYYYTCYYLAEG